MKITQLVGVVLGVLALSTTACSSPIPEPVGHGSSADTGGRAADDETERAPEESQPCTLRDKAQGLPCLDADPAPAAPSAPAADPPPPAPTSAPAAPPAAPPAPPPADPPAVCDNARASSLGVIGQQCVTGGVLVTFKWTPANAGDQWLDLAYDATALFNLDTSRGFQGKDLQSRNGNIAQVLLPSTTSYAWRINTIAQGVGSQQTNWCPNVAGPGTQFTTRSCYP